MTRIALALLAVIALAGCSSAPAPAPPAVSNEAAYLTLMDDLWPGVDDATWITLGHNICARLDAGQTPDQVAATMLTTGAVNEAGTKVLLRASVVTYCPTHEDVVPAQQ